MQNIAESAMLTRVARMDKRPPRHGYGLGGNEALNRLSSHDAFDSTDSSPMTGAQAAPPFFEKIMRAGPNAPWMTLVHGVSQDRRLFSEQIARFERTYRILLVDLPGHGGSSAMPGPYGLEEFAASLRAGLEDAGVARSHFWGTHLGASTGLLLACREPGRFASLLLEAPVFPGRKLPAVAETLAQVAAAARDRGMAAARELWWREGAWFDVMRRNPELCRAAAQRAIIEDFQGGPWLDSGLASRPIDRIDPRLATLETPVLIMNGEHDLSDFLEVAEALAALLPNCRRVTIAEAGGFPLWEYPGRANLEVERFLDDI